MGDVVTLDGWLPGTSVTSTAQLRCQWLPNGAMPVLPFRAMSARAPQVDPMEGFYWGTREQACTQLGLSHDQLATRRRAGKITTKRDPEDGRALMYKLPLKGAPSALASGDTVAIQHIIDLRVRAERAEADRDATERVSREWAERLERLVARAFPGESLQATGTNG